MKHSGEFDNEDAGGSHIFSIRLPGHITKWLQQAANQKDKTAEQFLQELIVETLEDKTIPLDVRLRRIHDLIEEIVILARKTPMREQKDAKVKNQAFEERKKKRDHLFELGMEAYEELRKISQSEKASKEAEFRMRAFTIMARVGMFNAAVIRDQEAEDVVLQMAELEEENERIDEEIEKLVKENKEEEARRAALA